ncbi:quinol:electron acceptor oxidoreductase subunit ActD [uncultured Gimesia sp.]|uniref:quinol:electron acceptor oxidoreductase subunit ActD n=1 Tax=uncultured Gimesia sp. TaxID=1678688 RepID=UPI0030D93E74|tara:strand:+ start:14605 stop:16002 length:1398 start_codon:yes stop_codon:yes gene_type:complete
MATTIEQPVKTKAEPELLGLLAEFDDPNALIEASKKVRDAGYRNWDTHTPFPLHGIDEAMGIKWTILPWIVACCGLMGGTVAISMQWYMNAYDYPFLISGKPAFSIPACIPIVFELSVLLAAFGAFFGMLGLNQLPKLYNPIFKSDAFRRATNDRFFISMVAKDAKFSEIDTGEFLKSLNPTNVEEFWSDVESPKLPRNLKLGLSIVGVLMIMGPALIAYVRSTKSNKPRIHIIQDMDFQPSLKAQNTTSVFSDGREIRPNIKGTIARGQFKDDNIPLYYGLKYLPEDQNVVPIAVQDEKKKDAKQAVEKQADAAKTPVAKPAATDAAAAEAKRLDSLPWITEFPMPVTEKMMARGKERYRIYCSACHGLGGDGDGLVTLRAMELQQGTWVKPASYHTENVRKLPIGRLYNTITNGVRKMPAYGSQIPPEDRWTIVLYLKALQKSRLIDAKTISEEEKRKLRDTK